MFIIQLLSSYWVFEMNKNHNYTFMALLSVKLSEMIVNSEMSQSF